MQGGILDPSLAFGAVILLKNKPRACRDMLPVACCLPSCSALRGGDGQKGPAACRGGWRDTVLVLQTGVDQTGAVRSSQEAWVQLDFAWHFSLCHCCCSCTNMNVAWLCHPTHCRASLHPSCLLLPGPGCLAGSLPLVGLKSRT